MPWELIESGNKWVSDRLWVYGGWIVRTITYGVKDDMIAQTFVSDVGHEWKL